MAERNDEWIKLWDAVPAEHQWIFEQTNEHYNAAFGSMLKAVLQALTQIEENQTAFSHPIGALVAKQDLITEHLQRQDSALEAVSKGQTELRAEFQATGESLSQWRAKVDTTLDDFRRQLHDLSDALEAHVGERGHLTKLIEAATAKGRRRGKAEGRDEERANPGGE